MLKIDHHFIFFFHKNNKIFDFSKFYILCSNYSDSVSIQNLIYSPKFAHFSDSIYSGCKGLTSDEDYGRIFTSIHFERLKKDFETERTMVIEDLFFEGCETPNFKLNTLDRSITFNLNNYYFTLIANLIAYPIQQRMNQLSPFILKIDLEIDSLSTKVPIDIYFGSFNSFEDALLYLKNNYHNL
jgi:hypothetical protein